MRDVRRLKLWRTFEPELGGKALFVENTGTLCKVCENLVKLTVTGAELVLEF